MSFNTYAHLTTEQRKFNHVCRHLAQQKRRALAGDSCVYYDEGSGDRCAGLLLFLLLLQ